MFWGFDVRRIPDVSLARFTKLGQKVAYAHFVTEIVIIENHSLNIIGGNFQSSAFRPPVVFLLCR